MVAQRWERAVKVWRAAVLARDQYRCQDCGNPATDVHHILPWRAYPALRVDPGNGISLCRSCHCRTFGREEQIAERYFVLLEIKEPKSCIK